MINIKRSLFSDLSASNTSTFDIVTAFEVLDIKRQETLVDQLLNAGPATYRNMVKLYWPQASASDAKVLDKYLRTEGLQAAA
ncbi:MAG: hypothetical protein V4621_04640 [Pseudomonadota bacterium]